MLLTIIAVLAWLVGIWAVTTEADGWGEHIAFGLGGAVVGFIFIGLAWFGLEVLLGSVLPHTLVYETKPLVALQDSNQVGGNFFLGIGQIDSKPTYTYYVSSNGGSRLQNVSADKIDVYQDSTKPYLKIVKDCKSNWQWVAECNPGMNNTSDDKYDVVEIHVPKNTIKQNFVLDAK